MGDPANPARVGEAWNPYRVGVLAREIERVREFGVLSGGWAWHFMSPPHHEIKQLHDHKDIDLFVDPPAFSSLVTLLQSHGYARAWTRFDDPSSEFIRFARHVERACPVCHEDAVVEDEPASEFCCLGCQTRWAHDPCAPVKVIFDLFVEAVPSIELANGIRVVEPATLLSFYGVRHSSDLCVAVRAARELVARAESVPGHPSLVGEHQR